jgi:hypothetical protein
MAERFLRVGLNHLASLFDNLLRRDGHVALNGAKVRRGFRKRPEATPHACLS